MVEKTLKSKTVFNGRLLRVEVIDVKVHNGRRSIREIVRHPGAAVVLAQLVDGRFVFVRQFRKAVEKTILEVVAGGLEKGESPVDCARRELSEETGYTAMKLVSLGTVYPAPGYTDEVLHLYFAVTGRVRGIGSPDDDERLAVEHFSEKQVDRMISDGRIHDAKTLAVWMLWKAKISRK